MNEAELSEMWQTDGKSLNRVDDFFLEIETNRANLQVVAHVIELLAHLLQIT